jgi:hypothetical protein
MTPKTITLADDVFEQVKKRAEAEGVTVEEAANEAVRLGLSEGRWQKAHEARSELQPRDGRSCDG